MTRSLKYILHVNSCLCLLILSLLFIFTRVNKFTCQIVPVLFLQERCAYTWKLMKIKYITKRLVLRNNKKEKLL